MGRPTAEIWCRCCGKRGMHNARGLRTVCYDRHRRAGTLNRFSLPQRGGPRWVPTGHIGEATLTKYIHLDVRGFSPARIRFELGLSVRQFQRYAKAAKARQQLQEATS